MGDKNLGVLFTLIGLVIIIIGISLYFFNWIKYLGHLPGDLMFKKSGLRVYIPITTMAVLNLLLYLVIKIFRHIGK